MNTSILLDPPGHLTVDGAQIGTDLAQLGFAALQKLVDGCCLLDQLLELRSPVGGIGAELEDVVQSSAVLSLQLAERGEPLLDDLLGRRVLERAIGRRTQVPKQVVGDRVQTVCRRHRTCHIRVQDSQLSHSGYDFT